MLISVGSLNARPANVTPNGDALTTGPVGGTNPPGTTMLG